MSADTAVTIAAVAVTAGAWAFIFLPPRRGMWTRTWIGAGLVVAVSLALLAATDRLASSFEPAGPVEVAVGLGVGVAWLVATHVGFRILHRLFPSLGEQVADLYGAAGDDDTVGRMIGPVVLAGIAEELAFRGVIQGASGLVVAVVAYTAVQVVERKWLLCLAALLSGLVWGLLFAWRDSLVAPIIAHLVWTGTLTFVWPLPRGAVQDGAQTSVSGWNWDQANQNAS